MTRFASEPAATTCAECGAPLPVGGTCRDHFHALLALEWRVPGGPGEVTHYYAVAAYVLQHPASMGYTATAIAALVAGVRDRLAGRASIADLRTRAKAVASSDGRVTRRSGDAVPRTSVETWPAVVTDVLAGGVDGYQERVAGWARAVLEAIDAGAPRSAPPAAPFPTSDGSS